MGTSKNQLRWLFEVPYGTLSIEGRVINQRLTLQLIVSLPPNHHPNEVFRCARNPFAVSCYQGFMTKNTNKQQYPSREESERSGFPSISPGSVVRLGAKAGWWMNIILTALILLWPVGLRTALLVAKETAPGWSDMRGVMADSAAGFTVIALVLWLLRSGTAGRALATIVTVVWVLINLGCYEFALVYEGIDALRHAHYLLDPTFFRGSVITLKLLTLFIATSAALGVLIMVATQCRSSPPLGGGVGGHCANGVGAGYGLVASARSRILAPAQPGFR